MLKLRHLQVNSLGENLAYMNKNCSSYKLDDVNKITKLEIQGGGKSIYALLQIVDDDSIVGTDEIALNNEAFAALNVAEGSEVSVNLSAPAPSLNAVKRKIAGDILTSAEYAEIMQDIASGRYSKMDIAAFLVACSSFMSATELVSITASLIGNRVLHWDEKSLVVDQHCLGGIPGNKTDLIVTAIVAAYGLPIVKTCIHSLTSCAGVADTMGCMAEVNLKDNEFQKLVRTYNGAIACYDSLYISKANRLLHDVRSQIGINQNEFVIASILSMMISAGVNRLVLDIPVGEKARIRTTNEAMRIRKQIEYVGDMLDIEIDVVITDGSEPIGNGIGAVLEARDVMKVLRNYEDAPQDLKEKSLFLAGRVLEFDPQMRGGKGYAAAKEILESGRALESFQQIVNAQGIKKVPELGKFTRDVVSAYDGVVESIDNTIINKIGVYSGATQYLGSGIDLHKKVGDSVKSGEVLYTIYSCNTSDFDVACSLIERNNGYVISAE